MLGTGADPGIMLPTCLTRPCLLFVLPDARDIQNKYVAIIALDDIFGKKKPKGVSSCSLPLDCQQTGFDNNDNNTIATTTISLRLLVDQRVEVVGCIKTGCSNSSTQVS